MSNIIGRFRFLLEGFLAALQKSSHNKFQIDVSVRNCPIFRKASKGDSYHPAFNQIFYLTESLRVYERSVHIKLVLQDEVSILVSPCVHTNFRHCHKI